MKNIVAKTQSAFAVLQAGRELTRPEAWKKAQTWVSLMIAMVGAAHVFGFGVQIEEGQIVGFIGVIFGILNAFVTVASSKKVGFQSKDHFGDRG